MTLSRTLALVTAFTLVVAVPIHAQAYAPVAVQSLRPSSSVSDAAVVEETRPSVGRTIVGGLLGGGVGALAGFGVFLATDGSSSCSGEDCGLERFLVSTAVGEAIGVAIGAHIGARSQKHERLLLSSLASAGILAGSVAIARNNNSVDGHLAEVLIPLTPILQLATVVAIEAWP